MNKPTSWSITMDNGEQMRISLGSLYVLNTPISAYDYGRRLLTYDYEVLIVMLVAIVGGKMLFYGIAVRDLNFLRRLEEISFRMLNSVPLHNQHTLTYEIGDILIYTMGKLIKGILRIIRYYSRESVVINSIRSIKSKISGEIKQIRKDLDRSKKPQISKLVEISKNNIDKIIEAMLINQNAIVSIKTKRLSLFRSFIWCKASNIKAMKWHEIGRIVDIKQWPARAIRLWASHHLDIAAFSLVSNTNQDMFTTIEGRKDAIEYIQRNNVSKRSTIRPTESLWPKDLHSRVADRSADHDHGTIVYDYTISNDPRLFEYNSSRGQLNEESYDRSLNNEACSRENDPDEPCGLKREAIKRYIYDEKIFRR